MSGILKDLAKLLSRSEVELDVRVGPTDSPPPCRLPYYPPSCPAQHVSRVGHCPPHNFRSQWNHPRPPCYGSSMRPGQPPYYPPYPSYPGPPGAPPFPDRNSCYPPPPPSYNPGMYPGASYPSSPAQPMYPALHPGEPPMEFKHDEDRYGSADYYYVPTSGGNIPPGAVAGGMDKNGWTIYVGRASHEMDLLPAKVCPGQGCAYISYGGQEIAKMHYEVLCGRRDFAWKPACGSDVPPEAVSVGRAEDGEPLYVGRTMIDGTMTPGKVHRSHGVLYIPYDGKELSFSEYEVLIMP